MQSGISLRLQMINKDQVSRYNLKSILLQRMGQERQNWCSKGYVRSRSDTAVDTNVFDLRAISFV
jgi:hypothetical protein